MDVWKYVQEAKNCMGEGIITGDNEIKYYKGTLPFHEGEKVIVIREKDLGFLLNQPQSFNQLNDN